MKKLSDEDKAGIYITVIFHLAVIIVFLTLQISRAVKNENSFVLDFSKEEALEKKLMQEKLIKEEEEFNEAISKKLDELISGADGSRFRNIAVDRGELLKDDRNTDAEQLYADAERLAAELKNGIVPDEPEEDYVPLASLKDKKESAPSQKAYTGPSVVSYFLEGRKASTLPIPAYKCFGGGMVTVIITVDNAGNVTGAKVQDEASSEDKCLREFAVRAARLSRFSSSPTAPARQAGNIIYQFIAQR